MIFKTSPISQSNWQGTIGGAIYDNITGSPGEPNNLIASGTIDVIGGNLDNEYHVIAFDSPAFLISDELYWVAIAVEGLGQVASGFHDDYGSDSHGYGDGPTTHNAHYFAYIHSNRHSIWV